MWRKMQIFVRGMPIRKASFTTPFDKTGHHTNKKDSRNTFILMQSFKVLVGLITVGHFVNEERENVSREKQIILLGKRESGTYLVSNSLLSTGNNETNNTHPSQKAANGTNCTDEQIKRKPASEKEVKRNLLSSGVEEKTIFHERCQRNVKITHLHIDDQTSLSANALSTLLTTDDYTVVYCVPVSYRFTTEDWDLLQRYLPYQHRKDFKKTIFAFTFSDRFGKVDTEIPHKVYTETFPEEFKNFLKECGNRYFFVDSSQGLTEEDEDILIKYIPDNTLAFKLIVANAVLWAGPFYDKLKPRLLPFLRMLYEFSN